jgi:arsenite-transporting ATPase
VEVDAGAAFEGLKAQYAEELNGFLNSLSPGLDLTFDRQVMERIMDLSPPGLDEVMALSRLMGFLAEERHDCLVLDSAPTGHLIRLLELPGLIERWLRVVFDLLLKYREVLRAPGLSQRLVEVSKGLKHLRALLGDRARSALYVVSILTEMALEETRDLVAACDRVGVGAPALFLNLATPASECPLCSEARRAEARVRRRYREAFPDRPQTLVFRGRGPVGVGALKELGWELYR